LGAPLPVSSKSSGAAVINPAGVSEAFDLAFSAGTLLAVAFSFGLPAMAPSFSSFFLSPQRKADSAQESA
jgi:hypothetical protein